MKVTTNEQMKIQISLIVKELTKKTTVWGFKFVIWKKVQLEDKRGLYKSEARTTTRLLSKKLRLLIPWDWNGAYVYLHSQL